jgi:hypothetical protein
MGVKLPIQNNFTKTIESDEWIRPSDWPVITDANNEVQFLFSDINNASCTIRTNFNRNSGSQNITIDWGDGTTDVVTTNATTNTTHVYTPETGTPCSRGYTTFKIRVYFTGTGSSVLTACRLFGILIGANTANIYNVVGLLEVYYGNGTQIVNMDAYYYSNANSTSSLSSFTLLEYVKLPATVNSSIFNSTFDGCTSLSVVVMPTSASLISSFNLTFQNCYNLRSITFPPNATGVTTFSSCFLNCFSLTSVTFPTTLNSVSDGFANMFQNCFSLKNVTFPSVNICTNFASAFSSCLSLEWVRFTSLPIFVGSVAVSFVGTFSTCNNLQNVYFPATCSANANYNFTTAFAQCFNLKSIVFPVGFNPSNLTSAFASCYNLKRVVFQSGASNLTSLSITFQSCYYLTDLTLPSSVSSLGITLSNMLQNCYALKTITIPNYLITSLQSTFINCRSLQTINWTPGTQNSLTSMISAFQNCSLLKTITLPTTMNALQSILTAFSGCRSLTSLTFPATLNSMTSINSAFASCYLLTSVTLPTSATALTDFTGAFNSCFTIRTITLPATVSTGVTGFASTFNACSSLRTVTFPSSPQMINVSTLVSAFAQSSNLNSLINFNKVGSLGATPLVNGGSNAFMSIPSISFSCPLSVLGVNNTSSGLINNVQAVRLLNTSAGQWTGTSPQINVSFTNMSTANLVQLFNDMAAQGTVTSKTINITGATGAAGLTAANRLLITSKGWTITG